MKALAALLILLASPAMADVTGPARVIDGDTISIGATADRDPLDAARTRIRLRVLAHGFPRRRLEPR